MLKTTPYLEVQASSSRSHQARTCAIRLPLLRADVAAQSRVPPLQEIHLGRLVARAPHLHAKVPRLPFPRPPEAGPALFATHRALLAAPPLTGAPGWGCSLSIQSITSH